jgi:hypothetical protein
MLISNIISLTAAILSGIIIYGALINLLNIKEVTTLRNKLLSMTARNESARVKKKVNLKY